MDAATRLGGRNPLHPVHAGLEFQGAVGAITCHPEDHFLVASDSALAHVHHLHLPAAFLAVALVHAVKVTREQAGLIAAGAGPHFHDAVAGIIGVLGHQHQADLLLHGHDGLPVLIPLGARHFQQVRIALRAEDLLGPCQVVVQPAETQVCLLHRFQVLVLAAELAEAGLVGDHGRVGEQLAHFRAAVVHRGQLLQQRVHAQVYWKVPFGVCSTTSLSGASSTRPTMRPSTPKESAMAMTSSARSAGR